MSDDGKIGYFSREWVERVVELTNADPQMPKLGKGMHDKHVYIVLECPDATDRIASFIFKAGQIVEHSFESHPHPIANFDAIETVKGADFITTSTYGFYGKVNRKEIGAMKAMMSPDFRIQGDKLKMMRQVRALSHWQNLFAAIPVEY